MKGKLILMLEAIAPVTLAIKKILVLWSANIGSIRLETISKPIF